MNPTASRQQGQMEQSLAFESVKATNVILDRMRPDWEIIKLAKKEVEDKFEKDKNESFSELTGMKRINFALLC